MRRIPGFLAATAILLTGCASSAAQVSMPFGPGRAPATEDGGFIDIGYAEWTNEEPAYLLYPGDEIELVVPAFPDFNRVLTVQPDGRVRLPDIGDVMTAGRTIGDIENEASRRYANVLRRPQVNMSVKAAPLKVFVGGEVGQPGAYDLIGDGNALQSVIQAGGFSETANLRQVRVIRRGASGTLMMKAVDLSQAFRHGDQPDLVPLARGDVIYVPRSGLANAGTVVQQFLAALPVSFSYAINGFGG